MSVKKRDRLLSGPDTIILLMVILIVCILVSFLFGRYPVPFKELCGILADKVLSIFGLGIEPFWTDAMQAAVWNVRLPRVIMSVLVGACLSAAGAAYQGVFQNPMAAPDVLGASAGAGFGAALAIYVGLSSMYITLAAFGMSLLTVALVFWVSRHAKGERVLGLVLAGIMVSSLFQAGTSFIKLAADPTNKLPEITYWLMGSFTSASYQKILIGCPLIVAGIIIIYLLRWRLNILSLSDDEARASGINIKQTRMLFIVASTLVTASAVSMCGQVGWIGLLIPHASRMLVGSNNRYVVPLSLSLGASFMILIDTLSRSISIIELPLSILTAIIGAPAFISLLNKTRSNLQ